jgi:germination protein M
MAKKRINPELEKKYTKQSTSRRTISPGSSGNNKKKEDRNLGLLSLFFILLALVFVIGKFTIEGRFVSSPAGQERASMPRVTRMENLAPTVQESQEEIPPLPLIEEPPVEKPKETVEKIEPVEPQLREYQSRLFYLKINDEGQILLKSILRNITYESGLLGATLDSLLSGPSQDDLIKGYFTLIPSDTKINSVAINDGIAWIDVSDEFSYNHLGYEGYQAQLNQIIYTATEFSSVRGVKITINGKEEEFLSAEGVNISGILTRDDF